MIAIDRDKITLDEKMYESNSYHQSNPTTFMNFIQTLLRYPTCYGKMLKKLKFKELNDWLHQNLSFFDNDQFKFQDYSYAEIVHFIVNDIHDFPKCPICGNKMIAPKLFQNYGFMKGCTKKCSMICKANSFRETCMKTYGTDHFMKNEKAYNKYYDMFEMHHGVRNSFQLESTKKTIKATKKKRHGSENFTNFEKARQTRYQRYSGKWESKDTSTKRKQTFIEHYGVDNNMKCEEGLKAYEDAIEKKYGEGVRNISQSEDIKQKKINTCQRHFGVDWPLMSKEAKYKCEQTCIKKYGVPYVMQNPEIHQKAKAKYFYENKWFDSAPEIAFYVWLKDNDIPFEYKPTLGFQYIVDGKMHVYFPDFKIGDLYFEIKGDHFFDKNGNFFNPYGDQTLNISQAKWKCMMDNDVVILRQMEYRMFMLYVKKTYGPNYLKQFKVLKKAKGKQK